MRSDDVVVCACTATVATSSEQTKSGTVHPNRPMSIPPVSIPISVHVRGARMMTCLYSGERNRLLNALGCTGNRCPMERRNLYTPAESKPQDHWRGPTGRAAIAR